MPAYELKLSAGAARALERLPEAVSAAIVEFMIGPLLANPYRVGKRLGLDLDGYFGARRGAYRIIYRVEDERFVRVVRIDHRADVYHRR